MLQLFHRIIVVLTVAFALPAMAYSDPPARVGRLALIENQVFFRVDRNDQGGPATLNWPVSSGAIVETGRRGRAEVWIGSTAYRLADNSEIEFSAVDNARVDLRLNGGSLAVSILDRNQVNGVAVSTPDGNVRFVTPGRYRIDVFSDHSELSTQAGQALFDNRGRITPVVAGQKASQWSDGGVRVERDRDQDGFDRWVANRENLTLASVSRRYVSPDMTGYQDLDAYGDWQSVPDYGSVWYPRSIDDDWAPYRDGRWAWVAPWGWTWIDQAPWGFAPFHYGRWAIIQGRWGWVPGRPASRPVYAPALVGWIGNPGWSVSFSSGSAPAVGWFPLAPREVYVPSYSYSPTYVRQINISNVTDVRVIERIERGGPREAFANNTSPRAVTVVPTTLMREGRPISAAEMRHDNRLDLGHAPLAGRAPSTDWLAPTTAAARSHGDGRRDQFERPPHRDFDALRPNPPERAAPLPGNPNQAAVRPLPPEAGNGRGGEGRREAWRGSPDSRPGAENRGRPVDMAPAAPPAVQPPGFRQPAPEAAQPPANDGRRGFVRRQGDSRGDGGPPVRSPEAAPLPAPMRREMPAPEVRSEERKARPVAPPVEREPRPDPAGQRQFLHQERPAPREVVAPPVIRQPEMPRPPPAPEVRAPAPVPPQRAEPPRQQQAPQGGGQNEERRRHGNEDERGGR